MTCVSVRHIQTEPLVSGRAFSGANLLFAKLIQRGDTTNTDAHLPQAAGQRTPVEERLRQIQKKISEVSMHLPEGFAVGLNSQFANMMDDDAWEDDDELITPEALDAFVKLLLVTSTSRRPGIGTNGRGSITAAWTAGASRLTVECLSSGAMTVILSRADASENIERAAFQNVDVRRIPEVLAPFRPEVWFDR